MGCKDIVYKGAETAAQDIVEAIDELFRSEVKVNFSLGINEDTEGNHVIEDLVRDIKRESAYTIQQDDLTQILCELFSTADAIHVGRLAIDDPAPTISQSGSFLLQARPRYPDAWGASVVIKIAGREEISQEVRNYYRISPYINGQHIAVLRSDAYCHDLGGVVFSLLGANDWKTLESFADLFWSASVTDLTTLIRRFFEISFGNIYSDADRRNIDLAEYYSQALNLTPQKLATALKELFPDAVTKPILFFFGLELPFYNPYLWVLDNSTFRKLEVFSRTCLSHGDLHSRNILLDNNRDFWLIDFARVGDGHALRDFVELETDIKFNLLGVDDGDSLLAFEEALLLPNNIQDVSEEAVLVHQPDLVRAFLTITALRRTAYDLIDLEGDLKEYYEALFIHTLNIVRLRHINPIKKRHALMSAALISERLDKWPNWKVKSVQVSTGSVTMDDKEIESNADEQVAHAHAHAHTNSKWNWQRPLTALLFLFGSVVAVVLFIFSFSRINMAWWNYVAAILILILIFAMALAIVGIATGQQVFDLFESIIDRLFSRGRTM